MKKHCFLAIACQLLLTSSLSAGLLSYTGNPFTRIGSLSGAGNVTATFDFNVPLTPGAILTQADV